MNRCGATQNWLAVFIKTEARLCNRLTLHFFRIFSDHPMQPQKPLIRLRIFYSNDNDMFDPLSNDDALPDDTHAKKRGKYQKLDDEEADCLQNNTKRMNRHLVNLLYINDAVEMHPIKELTPEELEEKEKQLRKLREEVRTEEMLLVLLKKIKQSQLKENIAAVPKVPTKLPPPPVTMSPVPPPSQHGHRTGKGPPPLLRGQPAPSRGSTSMHGPPPGMLLPPTVGRNSMSSTGMASNMVIPQPPHPRGRNTVNTSNPYHSADRTERSTKDPMPSPAHQVHLKVSFHDFLYNYKGLVEIVLAWYWKY
ncbi:unnamed protein product [Trichogramma brassicae]|uniref:Transcriptional repressor p66 coiled-coil MBD2-interaction domain-containing protein n=1 Tax=Trichogramma brassicae TaxID=86971 RepID=A0A6H5IU55_9HYME|nr:unnamed protein product [Trichogramma brassicae]